MRRQVGLSVRTLAVALIEVAVVCTVHNLIIWLIDCGVS